MNVEYISDVMQLDGLGEKEKRALKKVTSSLPFLSNTYYLSLIDWDDPDDPIRRLVIPDTRELLPWARPYSSDEERYAVLPGVQHKYAQTVLLLVSNTCGGICRSCFRKRIFSTSRPLIELDSAISYVKDNTAITNVLLTGGDPLVLPARRLGKILDSLKKIDHVGVIRIGTKMPAFNPHRIINDGELLDNIRKFASPDKRIYIMTHFDHPKELTPEAIRAVSLLTEAGAILSNQLPIIRGVNDSAETLARLFGKLVRAGITPYYVFQCRPSFGNKDYAVPVEEGLDIVGGCMSMTSGIEKRIRFVMSHTTGKIEIVGKAGRFTCLKYHIAADAANRQRFMLAESNPDAYWLEDYNIIDEKGISSFTQEGSGGSPFHSGRH